MNALVETEAHTIHNAGENWTIIHVAQNIYIMNGAIL